MNPAQRSAMQVAAVRMGCSDQLSDRSKQSNTGKLLTSTAKSL